MAVGVKLMPKQIRPRDIVVSLTSEKIDIPDQQTINKMWRQLVKAYKNGKAGCSWCLLDIIGTITKPQLMPFFLELAHHGAEWYDRELAIYWLKNNYPEAVDRIEFSQRCLQIIQQSEDVAMQQAAFVGLRFFATQQAIAESWEWVEYPLYEDNDEEYEKRLNLFGHIEGNDDLSRHIILTPPTLNNYFENRGYKIFPQ